MANKVNADVTGATFAEYITTTTLTHESASRCFDAVSFSPWKHGDRYAVEVMGMVEHIEERIKAIPEWADKVGEPLPDDWLDTAKQQAGRIFSKWLVLYNDTYHKSSRCMSSAVTGPANFPVRRAEKASNAHRASVERLVEYAQKIDNYIKRAIFNKWALSGAILADDPRALEKLNAKLDIAKQQHELMKQGNAIVRKYGRNMNSAPYLLELGLPIPPEHCVDSPFMWGYNLPNSLARIKQIEGRIIQVTRQKEIEQKADGERKAHECGLFETGYMDGRYCLWFSGKPDNDTRQALKSTGFRFSPSRDNAWCMNIGSSNKWKTERIVALLTA